MRRLLVIIPIVALTTSCSGPKMPLLKGKLVYGFGSSLYELDLETRNEALLSEVRGGSLAVSDLDGTRLLVETEQKGLSRIQVMDRALQSFSDLRPGYGPLYMAKHRKLLFFQSSTATGPRLYLADMDRPTDEARLIAEDEGPFSSYSMVIPVSDDEVIFPIRGDAGKTPPYRYDLVTGRLEQLPFERRCTPYVWRKATRQLLCGIDGAGEYYLIGLDGQNITPVEFTGVPDKEPLPLLYVPRYDVLILSVGRFAWFGRHAGEHWDLWAYSLESGRGERIQVGHSPGRGGIAWVER